MDTLAALCGSAMALPRGGGIVLGLLLAGAAGSTMHCVPMCGGFVLGQVADRIARVPAAHLCEWQRLRNGVLLPYHLGRLTTYAGLGGAAGLAGATLGRLPWFGLLSGALLLLAAVLFLAQGVRRLAPRLARFLPGPERAPAGWNRMLGRMTRRLDRTRAGGGYLLGVALGFLPCGFLLYAALAAAASNSNPMLGIAGMVAFGLGTVPALTAVGIAGQAAGQRWQRAVAVVSPVVMLGNAALLATLALGRLGG
jgi:sulfite exporter TauE/SafE